MSDTIYYRKGFGPSDGDSAVMPDAEVITMLEGEITALRKRVEALEGALNYYAAHHECADDGPWGVHSDDFGTVARQALQPNGEAE